MIVDHFFQRFIAIQNPVQGEKDGEMDRWRVREEETEGGIEIGRYSGRSVSFQLTWV